MIDIDRIRQLACEVLIPELASIVAEYVPDPRFDEDSGRLRGIVILGKKHGAWRLWRLDAACNIPMSVTIYVDGAIQEYIRYHSTGEMASRTVYANGSRCCMPCHENDGKRIMYKE